MTLPAAAEVPPIVLFEPVISTPLSVLPRGRVPEKSVPMILPATRLPAAVTVPTAKMSMPKPPLAEMTLPAPATVPPIVVPDAQDADAVAVVSQGGGTGGVGADVVPLDHVPRRSPMEKMKCRPRRWPR